jgi:hypothetical protein
MRRVLDSHLTAFVLGFDKLSRQSTIQYAVKYSFCYTQTNAQNLFTFRSEKALKLIMYASKPLSSDDIVIAFKGHK